MHGEVQFFLIWRLCKQKEKNVFAESIEMGIRVSRESVAAAPAVCLRAAA